MKLRTTYAVPIPTDITVRVNGRAILSDAWHGRVAVHGMGTSHWEALPDCDVRLYSYPQDWSPHVMCAAEHAIRQMVDECSRES